MMIDVVYSPYTFRLTYAIALAKFKLVYVVDIP